MPVLDVGFQTLATRARALRSCRCVVGLRGTSNTTGPSATPGRWARLRGHHSGGRAPPGGKRGGRLQNVVGPTQFLDLGLQFFNAMGVCRDGAGALGAIDLGLIDPVVQGLRHSANLGVIDSRLASELRRLIQQAHNVLATHGVVHRVVHTLSAEVIDHRLGT